MCVEDAGATWVQRGARSDLSAVVLRAVQAVSATSAWAVGSANTVLRTHNRYSIRAAFCFILKSY